MAEPIKLEQEELQQIAQIQQITENIIREYGSIELNQKALDERKKKADDAYHNLLQAERNIAKELEEKYGKGSINVDEGTFTPFTNVE